MVRCRNKSKKPSGCIFEVQVFVDGALHTSGRNVHALRPESHRDLLLRARVCPVLFNGTCGGRLFNFSLSIKG
jgi:hypothetical protein